MKNINIYKYPIGKLRVQPVGIIIFAAVMATLGNFVLPSNLFLVVHWFYFYEAEYENLSSIVLIFFSINHEPKLNCLFNFP